MATIDEDWLVSLVGITDGDVPCESGTDELMITGKADTDDVGLTRDEVGLIVEVNWCWWEEEEVGVTAELVGGSTVSVDKKMFS